jgi:hypothetical protein
MAGPKVRLKQIIRAIGPLGYGDTASATGIRRTALAAALQYRCLAAVLQEPVCWRTRWVRTGVLGAETGSPASRLLQFRVVSGLVGLASAGKATVSYRGIERVSRRACIGGTGFSRESDRCHTAEFSVLRLASSRLKPVPLWNAVRPVGPISTWDGRRASRDAYPRRAWALSDAWQRFCRSRLAGERGGSEPRVLAAETGSPASRLLQFASCLGWWDRLQPGSCCSAFDSLLIFIRKKPIHRQTRLGCRLNAGLVEWAERHGCRESRPPPWMADGGGPTERDRSEGTLTKEGPNQEQAPLVTSGWCDFRLFQVTRRRRNSRPPGRRS